MSGERTEQATPERRKKAAEKGDSVRSRELTSAAALLAGLVLLGNLSRHWMLAWRVVFERSLSLDAATLGSPDRFARSITGLLLPALAPVATVMAAAFVAAAGSGVLQTGGVKFRAGAIGLKFSRLSPAGAVKQIFSTRSLVRLLKSLLPAFAVLCLGAAGVKTNLLAFPMMSVSRMPQTFASAYGLAIKAAWISLAWSLLDYAVEWAAWNKRLRMSKQEIREEARESNGNPQIKGRIRQVQHAMRRRRVKADMSRAAVVITNPTHYAVVLEFSYETMSAPKVLAKGRDLQAAQIREEARWAGVPMIENPPLARSLYRTVKEGQSIPFELYTAVAAILAYLYRQQQRRQAPAAESARHYNAFERLPNRIASAPEQEEEIA